MTVLVLAAASLIGLAVGWLVPGSPRYVVLTPTRSARGRAAGPTATPDGVRPAASTETGSTLRRAVACIAAATLVGWALLGLVGLVVGGLAGIVLTRWVGRLEPRSVARARARAVRDLPIAVDLLAACSAAGRGMAESLAVVSSAVGGPVAARFDEVAARVQLGSPPAREWGRLAADPLLGGLGRTLERALETGAPVAEGLARLAADQRRLARSAAQERARSVAVRAAAPLALCFLPAFMVLGVVPTVVGGFTNLLG